MVFDPANGEDIWNYPSQSLFPAILAFSAGKTCHPTWRSALAFGATVSDPPSIENVLYTSPPNRLHGKVVPCDTTASYDTDDLDGKDGKESVLRQD